MNDEQKYHLINQYLNGELVGRALDNFKALLKDSKFKEEVDLQAQIIKQIEVEREAELKAYIAEHSKVNYFQNTWGNRWTLASAAIFIIFVSAFFIMKYYSPETNSRTIVLESPEETTIGPAHSDSVTQLDSGTYVIENSGPPSSLQLEEAVPLPTEEFREIEEDQEDAMAETEVFNQDTEAIVAPSSTKRVRTDENVAVQEDEITVKKDQKLGSKNFIVTTLSPGFLLMDDADSTEGNKDKEIGTRAQLVEFWSSPVNFKGYFYSSSVLKLFSINESANLDFKELDNRLYLSINGTFYYLEKNGSYNKFVAVTNSKLLQVLND